MKLKKGDIVYHKTSNQKMVITHVEGGMSSMLTGYLISCRWMFHGEVFEDTFDPIELRKKYDKTN